MNTIEVLQQIGERRDAQKKALLDSTDSDIGAPWIFKEQKHLDSGSVERVYWHYGYMMALTDVFRLLEKVEAME